MNLNLKGKEKVAGIKKPKNRNNRNLLGFVFSILVAVCVFVGLTSYQSRILSAYEKCVRVVAVKDIAAGTMISEQNAGTYFKEQEIEVRRDVTQPVENVNDLVGYVSQSDIAAGQTLSYMNFATAESLAGDISDTVYLSFTVNEAGNAVGGTIREGNIIDVDVATEEGVVSAGESIYVNAVYDSGYVKLTEADEAPATTIEVALSSDDVEAFVAALHKGTPYVSRRR